MITIAPLKRLMAENGYDFETVSQLSGISTEALKKMNRGYVITKGNIEKLCHLFKCQPCDIIEYTEFDNRGHWVYVPEK